MDRLRALELPARGHRRRSRCDVAVLLNLEPDHLDRHGTFEAYRDAKLRIFENQARTTRRRPARASAVPDRRRVEFARRRPAAGRAAASRGAHNRENAAAATAAARAAGIADERDRRGAARRSRASPHRLELVARARRRPLRQRLEGDEHRRGAPRARRVRDAPVHLILGGSLQGRGLRAARRAIGAERALAST